MTNREATRLASKALIGLAVCAAIYRLVFLAISTTAMGTVTELVPQESSETDELVYLAMFIFETADGEAVHGAASWASFPAGFDTGQEIRVRYLPFAPSWAVIDTVIHLWGTTMFFGGMGWAFWVFHGVMAKVHGMMSSRSRR